MQRPFTLPLEKEPSQAAKGVPLFGDQPRLGCTREIDLSASLILSVAILPPLSLAETSIVPS